MLIVPEAACPGLLSLADAFPAVEAVFAAMATGDARNFPVVREALGHEDVPTHAIEHVRFCGAGIIGERRTGIHVNLSAVFITEKVHGCL